MSKFDANSLFRPVRVRTGQNCLVSLSLPTAYMYVILNCEKRRNHHLPITIWSYTFFYLSSMYHCYVLSPFCCSSRAVQYGVQKIIYERAQIMYNFDLFANGLLNTKFSEVCSFSLQLAHDESFHFPDRCFLAVSCRL